MPEYRDYFEEETIDLKEIVFKIWRHWKLFLAFIIFGLCVATFKEQTRIPNYTTTTTLLINDQKSTIDPQSLMGLDFYNNQNKIINEIEILRSHTLLKQTFNNLDFGIYYYQIHRFNKQELYKSCPFRIKIDSNYLQPINYNIKIKLLAKDSVKLEFQEQIDAKLIDFKTNKTYNNVSIPEKTIIAKFNDTITSSSYGFIIVKNIDYSYKTEQDNLYSFRFNHFRNNLKEFKDLHIENIDKSSVIKVSLNHPNLLKSVDFLNELTKVYLNRELQKKNNVADKSLIFIEKHLQEINDSLLFSEKNLQEYQAAKSALNIDFQTQNMFEQLEQLQNSKAESLIIQKYFDYLLETLLQDFLPSDIIAPSIMNINNPILTSQIANLIEIQSELNNLKISSDRENPYINSLISKIDATKNLIVKYVQNENNNIDIKIKDFDTRINSAIERINSLPQTQRELFNFERNFKVYDNIYTFLLQKRSETLLAKASNVPINEIIDKASIHNFSTDNKRKNLNYLISLLLSLTIPALFIYIKYFFNSKILTDKDIEKETNTSIIGHIIYTKNTQNAFEKPKSPIAESFRMLRTNLDFVKKTNESQTILVTSTMQGEGKSFISGNLARSLALNNRKTILLVFDLRKPMLYFNIQKHAFGLTQYLIDKCSIADIIQNSDFENLDIINAGDLPPNPPELIESKQTNELFSYLKKNYDFIIVDTPPIGIISDGLSLTKFSDINLFITRYNHTKTKAFSNILKRINTANIKNINIVTNSLEVNKKGYGYSSTYGDYGSYQY